jgi:putative ABC transport system permease protein
VSSGYLRAARTEQPDQLAWMFDGEEPVALLGPAAAEALGVPVDGTRSGLQVWVDGNPYDVVGRVSGGTAGLDHAVVVPYATALAAAGSDDSATMLVRTEPGAGAVVADAVSLAIRPDDPSRLDASRVVSVESLRKGVSTQLDRLAGWTGSVLMALTVLLIANSMVVAVTARTAEIGLRRALGFSRSRVAGVFLTEGALVGLVGGLAGSALAAVTVVVTAAVSGWSVVLQPWLVASGPGVGAVVGLVASLYPALRAARISPALAVRSD